MGSDNAPTAKRALITGVTGQDGAYLAEFLISKGYNVHGIKRRSSSFNTSRIDHLLDNWKFTAHFGDLTDATNLLRLVQEIQPTEIYNLGAQSHVAVSFETPEYTANADACGTLRLLEAVRTLKYPVKFYQASTSEMYGGLSGTPYTETSPFYPRSPYAAAKLYAYWMTVNYREAYGIHASNGILFNHESPIRGETFVSRKITRAVAKVEKRKDIGIPLPLLILGNLNAVRDWGHARDYVEGMWLMLQQANPGDYILATGQGYSVRDFVGTAFSCVGRQIEWFGQGIDEFGVDVSSGQKLIQVHPHYFRPTEADCLIGDASKAKAILGWTPRVTFHELVREMVENDLKLSI